MNLLIIQLCTATSLMLHFLGVTNGSFYTDTVKRSHPGSKLPSAKEYSKNDKLGQKEEAENRKVFVIEHSSEEKFGQPDLKSIKVLPCNTTKNLTKAGEWFKIQSKGFGNAKGNYFPGEYCYWKFTGVKTFCIPEIKCDKVDLRSVDDERVTIYDRRTGKIVLFGADHFHELKRAHDHKGLIVQFHASPSEKRKRHFDGFMCLVTCNRECADELDANTCPYSLVDPHKPPPICPDPIKTHDCEHENTVIHLLAEPKKDCKQEIIIPLKEGSSKSKIEINITLPKESIPEVLDFYFLIDQSRHNAQNFKDQLQNIINAVKGLGKNVRVGLGSFLDKNDNNVARTQFPLYSFQSHVPLEDAAAGLVKHIQDAMDRIKAYAYSAEANTRYQDDSLTAIHQAAVCWYINWRKDSKKVILLITDRIYNDNRVTAKNRGYEDFNPNECYKVVPVDNTQVFSGARINFPNPEDVVSKLKENGVSLILTMYEAHAETEGATWTKQILHPLKPNSVFTTISSAQVFSGLPGIINKAGKELNEKSEAYLIFGGRNISSEHFHFHSAKTLLTGAEVLKCKPPVPANGNRTVTCIFEAQLSSCPRNRESNRLEETIQIFLQGYSKPISTFYFDLYCNHKSGFGLHG